MHQWCLQCKCSGHRDASLPPGVGHLEDSPVRTSLLTCAPGRNWEAAPAVRVPGRD